MENTDSKSTLERIAALEMQLSEYQKIELQLRESEEKYRQLFDSSRDALMTITSPSWKYTEANKAALQLFGVASIEEFTALGPWDVSPQQQPDGRSSAEKAQEMIAIAIQEGSNAFEWEHQRLDGKAFTSDVLLTRLELDGQILVQATVRDISERKQNEEKLKLFRTLLDRSSDAIEILEPFTMRFLDVNETECKTLGYTKEEILSMSVFDIDLQLDTDSTNELYQLLQNKENVQIERIHRRKDGSLFPVEVNLALVEHDKTYLLGIARDITERKIAEQSLRESEEKFHSITVSAQDAILMMNDEGNISYWNEAAERMFGYSENEIMGWPLHEMLAPERFLEAHHKAFDHFKKTGEGAAVGKTLELVALKKDNTEFPIELSLSTVMSNGRWNAIGIIRDITERKKMEFELKQNEEMMIAQSKQAAMGDMIAMIAHQWRQPLAIMGMDINNLIMSISFDEEITTDYLLKLSEALSKQLHQLSETIDNFRNFFMPGQSRVQITMEEVLENTLNIIGASCENNTIALTIQNTSKSSLFINKSSLIQVLLNLLGNAKDILLANKVAKAAITITANETNEAVTISICDNGGGIPESILDKIGQPYFTTKKDLNGTGLGLYISRIIIEKHLFGTLRWYNKEGGACFEVTLKIKPD